MKYLIYLFFISSCSSADIPPAKLRVFNSFGDRIESLIVVPQHAIRHFGFDDKIAINTYAEWRPVYWPLSAYDIGAHFEVTNNTSINFKLILVANTNLNITNFPPMTQWIPFSDWFMNAHDFYLTNPPNCIIAVERRDTVR